MGASTLHAAFPDLSSAPRMTIIALTVRFSVALPPYVVDAPNPGHSKRPFKASSTLCFAPNAMAMEVAPPAEPQGAAATPKTLVELAIDGQKQLDAVVEAAHDILLSLNRGLCSPSFWVAPSLQPSANGAAASDPPTSTEAAQAAASTETEKGSSPDSAEGLAALDATRVRYKNATSALRATVTAIVKQTQAARADGEAAPPAENVDTETDYLERRVADLREEVERKNMIVKLYMDQLRTLSADIFMWQTTGF